MLSYTIYVMGISNIRRGWVGVFNVRGRGLPGLGSGDRSSVDLDTQQTSSLLGTILGVPIIRTVVFGVYIGVPAVWENTIYEESPPLLLYPPHLPNIKYSHDVLYFEIHWEHVI